MPSISSWDSRAPLVIAHRGASAYSPENTMASFRRAREMGADAIELDAKLTKDGVVVIMHDRTLNRTTNGSGPVKKSTIEEIQRLDAGSSFSPEFRNERIPTLEAVLEELGEEILLNVELTNYTSPLDELPQQVIRLVSAFELTHKVLLSSFNPLALMKCRRLNEDIPIGLLVHPGTPRLVPRIYGLVGNYEFLLPHESLIKHGDERWGGKVIAWTVNLSERIQELLAIGITGIITDIPDVALQVRAQTKSTTFP